MSINTACNADIYLINAELKLSEETYRVEDYQKSKTKTYNTHFRF